MMTNQLETHAVPTANGRTTPAVVRRPEGVSSDRVYPALIYLHGGLEQGHAIMAEPRKYLTPELEAHTREKIARVACPILLVHGDMHPINRINRINHEIVIPELQRAGKELKV